MELNASELTSANHSGNLDCDNAIKLAYLMASRWGGTFEVLEPLEPDNRGGYKVQALDTTLPAPGGMHRIGTATSAHIGDLEWNWADNSNERSPASPYDGLDKPQRAFILAHLEPRVRELHDITVHVMAVQLAFNTGKFPAAGQMITQGPPRLALDTPVKYQPYIQMVQAKGMVDKEITRLENILFATSNVLEKRSFNHISEASDILFGRVPVPVQENLSGPHILRLKSRWAFPSARIAFLP